MRQLKTVSLKRAQARAPAIPDPVVAHWIKRTLAADPPRAKSLIVTVWGDALAPHGGAVWLAGLIRLLAPFGINERLARTSVFRLTRDGWLEAEAHGRRSRYRLTAAGARRWCGWDHRPSTAWPGRRCGSCSAAASRPCSRSWMTATPDTTASQAVGGLAVAARRLRGLVRRSEFSLVLLAAVGANIHWGAQLVRL